MPGAGIGAQISSGGTRAVATVFEDDGGDSTPDARPLRRVAVFPGYRRIDPRRWRRLLPLVVLFWTALILGALIAYLPAARLSLLAIPVVALGGMIVWVLPEGAAPPVKFMTAMFLAYFVALTIWPYYLAFDIPGFPLIEIRRVFVGLAILALMVSLSISAPYRKRLGSIIAASPLIFQLYAVFVAFQVISLPLARDPATSISAFVRDQMAWTAVLLIGSYIFTMPGQIVRWAAVFRSMAIFMSFLAFAESRNQGVLWAKHIPSFLKISDPATLTRVLTPSFRGNAYRVVGPFPVSLSMAEWLALTVPFLLYYLIFGKNLAARIICLAADIMVLGAILSTQARVGLVGYLVAHVAFTGAWALRARRLEKENSLIPTLVLAAYPIIIFVVTAAVLTVPALTVRLLGGGAQAASTDARGEQFRMAMPLVMRRPLNGYGVGHAAQTVGWTAPGGDVSLDSYVITLLIDYGVIGFLVYAALMITGVVQGFRVGMSSRDGELGYASAAAVGLCVWIVGQFVLSQEDNASVMFMMLALIVAARWRQVQQNAPHTLWTN